MCGYATLICFPLRRNVLWLSDFSYLRQLYRSLPSKKEKTATATILNSKSAYKEEEEEEEIYAEDDKKRTPAEDHLAEPAHGSIDELWGNGPMFSLVKSLITSIRKLGS